MMHRLSHIGAGRPSVSTLLVAGFFLAFFLSCFASVFTTDYGNMGAYRRLAEGPHGPALQGWLKEGRPLNVLITMLFQHVATEIEHLRYLRLVTVLGIALLAWCLFQALAGAGWNRFQSACVAMIACTSLPFQVYAAWVDHVNTPLAALASGLAFLLSERAFETHRSRSKWLLAAGAILTLLAALAIYQPAAMFFWVFAAVALVRPDTTPRDMLRRLGWYFAIAAAGMLAGFVMYRLLLILTPGDHVRIGLVRDLPTKIVWFLSVYLPDALNFVLPSPSYRLFPEAGGELSIALYQKISHTLRLLDVSLLPSHEQVGPSASHALAVSPVGGLSFAHKILDALIAWGVLAFIVGGLWLYFRGTRTERLWQCGIAVSLLFLAAVPNLVVGKHVPGYKSTSAPVSIIVLYAYFAFRGYAGRSGRWISPARAHAVLGVAVLVCALSAAWHVRTLFVVPQARELALMRSELARGDLSRVRGIRIVLFPRWQQSPHRPFVWREFGDTSSYNAPWARSMAFLLLRKLAPEHSGLPIESVGSAGFNDASSPPDVLVVDMRKFGHPPPTAAVADPTSGAAQEKASSR